MKTRPAKLERIGDDRILIEWSDGKKREYTCKELRAKCPCAACNPHKHGGIKPEPKDPMSLPVISIEETKPIHILGMTPAGHYAYTIQFSDGHNTGIYTFEYLRELGKVVNN